MKIISWTATILYAGMIFYMSSQTWSGVPLFPFADKIIHFFVYAILAGLLRHSFSTTSSKGSRYLFIYAAAIATFYGVTDELHQYFVPGRNCDFWDLLTDAIGSLAGAYIVAWILDLRRPRDRKV